MTNDLSEEQIMALQSDLQERLPEIFRLATERTSESRIRLADVLTSAVLECHVVLNEHESHLLQEIIDDLLANSGVDVRQILVERFAKANSAPRNVIISLACDESMDIAGPILRQSVNLSDEDLIFVAESHGHDHALAIATRCAISEAVADALITTGDVRVMQTVVENLGAMLSDSAMNMLAESARLTEALRAPLIKRPELSVHMASSLYWWVSSELRRTILRRYGLNPGQIDSALAGSIQELLRHHERDHADQEEFTQIIDWLTAHDALSAATLIQVLRMGQYRLFEALLGHMTGLRPNSVRALVLQSGGHALAAICRAAGVDKPSFVSIFLLSRGARPGEQIVRPSELSEALVAFDQITAEKAKMMMAAWGSTENNQLADSASYVQSSIVKSLNG